MRILTSSTCLLPCTLSFRHGLSLTAARLPTAIRPQSLLEGMNRFLKMLDITFRRDQETYRPRINKFESVKDVEQKKSGQFFFLDDN
ncbi:hypothetical protein GCK72_008298 [Caenorhabditis remanei]|uniref:Uncharacterized protein n=1 Tax=Caenorhabditis remanei TaxID=31234 RepID=A0A6A5H0N2_CAERE|nr:hypothetical protein GCK72_008298 [Caenorhabditis remanei]KAF1760052.1 hypothetical protein GCK72_008298 [Caenorhabditis remanei]